MKLLEIIKKVQLEQHSDNLIPDICEFMGVDEAEFYSNHSRILNTTMRVIYFAVRFKYYVIYGKYTRSNAVEICKVLNRQRSSYFHYKKLLRNDRLMIDLTKDFLSKYNYTSQYLDETAH